MRTFTVLKWAVGLPLLYLVLMAFGIFILVGVGSVYGVTRLWERWRRRRACAELKKALQRAADLKAEELARRRVGVICKGPWKDPRDRQRSFNEHLRDQARGRFH